MPPTAHTHDDRYYTESEVDNLINSRAPSSHNHSTSDITSGTLAVARGGTGQTSLDGLKSALGITNIKFESGEYKGSGSNGYNYPVSLTFSFTPKIVIIYGSNTVTSTNAFSNFMIVSYGSRVAHVAYYDEVYNPYCSWGTNSLSFYYSITAA